MLIYLLKRSVSCAILLLLYITSLSQNIRPYSQVFSQNLKGGTALFGNTSMHILNGTAPDLLKMNESGNAANGAGGIGFSNYGNDGENMQPAMMDAAVPLFTVFAAGSTWNYNNPNSDQGTAWRTLTNPPAANWVSGTGSFGYGLTQTVTIPTGHITNYFLKNINIPAPTLYSNFNFTYSYNDGVVIYVNGLEVKRGNMPNGTVSYTTVASGNGTTTNATFSIPAYYFVAGNNVIAAEIHQRTAASTTCFFDMGLTATTFVPSNATSSNLNLPAGINTIKFARLYWGGRIANSTITSFPDTLLKIKLRKGESGLYTSLIAPVSSSDQYAITGSEKLYQSYIDIKDFIQANGNGFYTVADVPCIAGANTPGGYYGGWCIVIAYENLTLPYNSVRIYDGFSQVFNSGTTVTQTVNLTGLNVPNNPLALGDAVLGTMAWEGDAHLSASGTAPLGDYIQINNITVSNAVNPSTNFWNGTISKNGAFVTTKNPNYTNQMGIDIDELEVGTGYGIQPNATSVSFLFGTEADQYFPSLFTFAIRMKDPVITIAKAVTDSSGDGYLQSNEAVTYTLSGTNTGPGAAYNTNVVDSLPTNINYTPNSLMINSAPGFLVPTPQTDAIDADFAYKAVNGTRSYVKFFLGTGATSSAGGIMGAGTSYNLSFKARVNPIPGSVFNTAHINSTSQAGDTFTDDATAIIGPSSTLAITLLEFTATLQNNKYGVLQWTTLNELDNDHYEVERSDNGIQFAYLGTVAGNGSTVVMHNYHYTDDINSSSQVVYYRLKIVDLSGRNSYSKIVALRLKENKNNHFFVYPNPFEDNLKVSVTVAKDVNALFRIFSFDGKEILNRMILLEKGDNIVVLNDLNGFIAGSYLLEVNTGQEKYVQKIVKK